MVRRDDTGPTGGRPTEQAGPRCRDHLGSQWQGVQDEPEEAASGRRSYGDQCQLLSMAPVRWLQAVSQLARADSPTHRRPVAYGHPVPL